jgi:integrase
MPRRKCPSKAHKHGDIWHYPDRKKQWRAAIYVKGRQTWHSFDTEDECQRFHAAETAHRLNARRPTPATQFASDKVGDVVRSWLQRIEKKIAEHPDVEEYVSDRYYLQSFLDKETDICLLEVPALNRRIVKEFIARRLNTTYSGPANKPWKNGLKKLPCLNALKREVAPIRKAFSFLKDENDSYINPWERCFDRIEDYTLGDFKIGSRESRPLETGEFGKLLMHCNDNNWSQRFLVLAMYIGFCAGMRRSEILNMRYGDVNYNKDWISVPKEKIDKKKKARDEPLGRVIPIPQSLCLAILNLRYHQEKDNHLEEISDDTKIFAYYRGKQWTAQALEQAFKTLTNKAEVKNFTFHGLRHTARNRTNGIFTTAETYWMYGWLPEKKTMADLYASTPTDDNRKNMKIKLDMLSVGMSGDLKDWDYNAFGERQSQIDIMYESTYPLEDIKRLYSMAEPIQGWRYDSGIAPITLIEKKKSGKVIYV